MSYSEMVKEDVLQYIKDEIEFEEFEDLQELEEHLNEELWTCDGVTGNGSGSYTFNREEAKKIVLENMDEVEEMCREFGIDAATVGEKFLEEDWEWFDVSTRCAVLGAAIAEALEEIEDEFDAAHEDEDEEA